MIRRPLFVLGIIGVLACILPSAGCMKKEAKLSEEKPVPVVVTPVVMRSHTDFEDFTGRMEAFERIELMARVTGYLQKVDFKEGVDVKKGTLLFEVDARSYKSEFDLTESKVNEANVRVKRLKADYERARVLRTNRSISQEEFDKVAGDYNEAVAAVDVAVASREVAKTNLDWTKVYAPIDGLTSRAMIDPGNLVKADETILTTIVSLDPIYAYFDVDERTMLRLRRLIREGMVASSKQMEVNVLLALSDEDEFTHVGTINFVENRLDPTTGTLRVRGIFPNSKRLLSPGLFVRVRLPIGSPHTVRIIPEIAVGSDQGQKYVYVVGQDNEVSYRKIITGAQLRSYRVVEEPTYKLKKDGSFELGADGKKIIVEGLEEGEKVVVSGLQRVRPRIRVDAKVVEISADAAISQLPILTRPQFTQNTVPAGSTKGVVSTP
jgi:RND family efflux transporter MFP subunit